MVQLPNASPKMEHLAVKPRKIALTQSIVDALTFEPGERRDDVLIYDCEWPGLFIRLRRGQNGTSKNYYVSYQVAGRGDQQMKLGATSDYTLMDARHRCYETRRDAADGKDPIAERKARIAKAKQTHLTFREVADRFIAIREKEGWRRNTTRGDKRYLRGPYFKPLHGKEFASITQPDIVECIRALGSDSVVKQARESLIMLYEFAQQEAFVEVGFNPAQATRPVKRSKDEKGRVLSDRELIAVWNAADGLGDYGRIVKLAILLGNRRDEIGRMRWCDLKDSVWHLPADRTKTGHARDIPLSAAALAIIGTQPAGRKHVFGAMDRDGFNGWSDYTDKIAGKLLGKLDGPFKLHDLRRTMRSGLTRLRVDRDVRELMIGHVQPQLERIYDREKLLALQADGFEQWSLHVRRLVTPLSVVA
jgi:integrase